MAARSSSLYRPEMDWSVDPELPLRLRKWKRQVISEIKLLMAEEKTVAFACTYVKVCSGEQGEQIIKDAGLSGETNTCWSMEEVRS
jgi:hypothetical protein